MKVNCRHSGGILEFGIKCKIINKKCILFTPNESKCSEENGGIINYLKVIGTYEKAVNNPKYTNKESK